MLDLKSRYNVCLLSVKYTGSFPDTGVLQGCECIILTGVKNLLIRSVKYAYRSVKYAHISMKYPNKSVKYPYRSVNSLIGL